MARTADHPLAECTYACHQVLAPDLFATFKCKLPCNHVRFPQLGKGEPAGGVCWFLKLLVRHVRVHLAKVFQTKVAIGIREVDDAVEATRPPQNRVVERCRFIRSSDNDETLTASNPMK